MTRSIRAHRYGVWFRSRLEARWATFFRELGVEWRYEPGALVGYGGGSYTPDFLLPQSRIYVEVKPNLDMLWEKADRIGQCIDHHTTPMSSSGIVTLGTLPDDGDNLPWHPWFYYDDLPGSGGVTKGKLVFTDAPPHAATKRGWVRRQGTLPLQGGIPRSLYGREPWPVDPGVRAAYRAARLLKFDTPEDLAEGRM